MKLRSSLRLNIRVCFGNNVHQGFILHVGINVLFTYLLCSLALKCALFPDHKLRTQHKCVQHFQIHLCNTTSLFLVYSTSPPLAPLASPFVFCNVIVVQHNGVHFQFNTDVVQCAVHSVCLVAFIIIKKEH